MIEPTDTLPELLGKIGDEFSLLKRLASAATLSVDGKRIKPIDAVRFEIDSTIKQLNAWCEARGVKA